MAGTPVVKGSTDVSVIIRFIDSTAGTPEEGVEHTTTGLALWYRRDGAAKTTITAAALASLTTAHTDGGIEHIDDGYYRLDVADAAFATGVDKVMIGGTADGMIVIGTEIPLIDEHRSANVEQWNGTDVASPNNAGYPLVDISDNALDDVQDLGAADSGTAQAIAIGSITLRSGASSTDEFYRGMFVKINTATTGAGQGARIRTYDGTTKVATFTKDLELLPTGTITYTVYPDAGVHVSHVEESAGAVHGEAEAGTLSTTVMTTNLTEATDDHYNDRDVIFLGGDLDGQRGHIEDYLGSTGQITLESAVTATIVAGQRFVIV